MIFSPTKDQVRQFFCESRRKQRDNLPLDGAEVIAADVIAMHPEYHALLDDPEVAIAGEWTPEQGTMNPILHLSLHMALFEQISVDSPPGVRAIYEQQAAKLGDAHEALHRLLECLGETVWHAQQPGGIFDTEAYLERLRKL